MPPRDAGTPLRRRPLEALLLAIAIVVAGAVVYHRALDYSFAQDDFIGLGRAGGLTPRLHGPWRWLGNQAIFDVLRPLAGLAATPYHVTSLIVHLACAVLMFVLLGRRFSLGAAAIAALFFATHPALFTAVYWISVIADSLALAFALVALLALEAHDRRRWLAVPCFALSLLAKESTLLLPVAAMLLRSRTVDASSRGSRAAVPQGARLETAWRDPVLLVMAALSAGYAIYFVASAYPSYFLAPHLGLRDPAARGAAAYAVGLGPHVLTNLLSYLGWTANVWLPFARGFFDAVDPAAYPWAIGIAALWLAGLAVPALRRRQWAEGGVLYLLLILPVLPLRHHTYHYYLYAPMLGAAWCLAALADWGFALWRAPTRSGAAAWIAATVVALAFCLNGYAFVRRIETAPFVRPELRSDPIIDRALIAERVRGSLEQARLPAGIRLLFWSPIAAAEVPAAAADSESYFEKNVRSALVDGLAVRVLFPQIRDVAFVHVYRSLPEPWQYAVYRPDGSLRVAACAELDSVLRVYPP